MAFTEKLQGHHDAVPILLLRTLQLLQTLIEFSQLIQALPFPTAAPQWSVPFRICRPDDVVVIAVSVESVPVNLDLASGQAKMYIVPA